MKYILFSLALAVRLIGAEFYVSPTGSAGNSGAIGSPWSLAHALSDPPAVNAGDTIYVRGGTYAGSWVSVLTGTSAAPIKVKAYSGERPILDSGNNATNEAVIVVNGAYSWFQGLELKTSNPVRVSTQTGSGPTDILALDGFSVYGVGVKIINNVIHDARQGISFWRPALDAELYGNIVYYNGWEAPDRGHGHGIYTQNEVGTKHILDNIVFQQFGYGIHAYGSGSVHLKGFHVEGNISFNNGELAPGPGYPGYTGNILIGGYAIADSTTVLRNYTYFPPVNVGRNDLGFYGGCTNFTANYNYFVGGDNALQLVNCAPQMADNLFDGDVNFNNAGPYPNNRYFNSYRSTFPPGVEVFVRPNQYEPGRAHVVIYNWTGQSSVSVNLSTSGLQTGAQYEIRDVQNFYGAPVASGTYVGGSVNIPMTGTTMTTPVGNVSVAPTHTRTQFGAFVVLPTSGVVPPPPPPPPAITGIVTLTVTLQ